MVRSISRSLLLKRLIIRNAITELNSPGHVHWVGVNFIRNDDVTVRKSLLSLRVFSIPFLGCTETLCLYVPGLHCCSYRRWLV